MNRKILVFTIFAIFIMISFLMFLVMYNFVRVVLHSLHEISVSVRIWQLTNGKLIKELMKDKDVEVVVFSPNGQYLAVYTSYGGIIWIYKTQNWQIKTKILNAGFPYTNNSLVFVSNKILAITDGKDIRLWTIQGHLIQILKGHKSDVTALACSNSNNLLASGSKDGQVLIWQIRGGKILQTIKSNSSITSLAFSSDDSQLLIATTKGIMAWSLKEQRYKWQLNLGEISHIIVKDSILAFTKHNEILLLDINFLKKIHKISHDSKIEDFALSNDKRYIAFIDGIFTYVYDINKKSLVWKSKALLRPLCLDISPNGLWIAVGYFIRE